ncbi:ROK family protein [Cognatishimia sp.]|uniref:ROK family protein n=1 Tax=Cognatishimia sp. TaxID=2211648 RepID=UPI00351217ED
MIAFAGIDLGGTKSEAQLFDKDWQLVERQRVSTPASYEALVQTVAEQVVWCKTQAGAPLPVGVGAAGLVDADDNAFTANLPAMGKPLPQDIAKAADHPITYINDCRALALSEAAFGAGQGYGTVMSLILGTGVGGGVAFDGRLRDGPTHLGGEYGHVAASAAVVAEHNLPIYQCGCGRKGCIEAYIAGPSLQRMTQDLFGASLTPTEIGQQKDQAGAAQKVWNIWLDLTADLLLSLIQGVDPNIIVIGGGLSQIPWIEVDLTARMKEKQLSGFGVPGVVRASGGDASGARGAALAAAQEAGHV